MTAPPILAVLGAMLVALVALRAPLVRDRAPLPPRLPAASAEPWMADALPDVGPQRRAEVARMLVSGAWERLPPRTRARALEVFLCPVP